MACGIGVCMTCVLPVIGDDGVTRMVRSCVEGPVFNGDLVRWDDIGTVPVDAKAIRELERVHRSLITMHLEKTLKSDRVLRDLRRHA